jgi:hypothetical protein
VRADFETARRGRRVPAFDELQSAARQLRRFVAGVLIAAAVVVVSVVAFNIVVDPFGTFGTGLFPTAIESDRSAKITLLEKLPYNPDVLIMGSSRSRPAQAEGARAADRPQRIQHGRHERRRGRLVGVRAPVAQALPQGPHHVLLFVSDGVGTNVVNPQLAADSRAAPYLPKGLRHRRVVAPAQARGVHLDRHALATPTGWCGPACGLGLPHRLLSRRRVAAPGASALCGGAHAPDAAKLSAELARMRRYGISHRLPTRASSSPSSSLLGYLNATGSRRSS